MRVLKIVGLALVCGVATASAQHGHQLEFGGFGTYTRYDPVFGLKQAFGGGVRLGYFLGENEPVDTFRRLFIDGDIYALTGDNVLRYFNGRRVTSYALSDPPDGEDVRPGHDYQQFAGTGLRNEEGRLYVWDATHKRVLVFNKDDGAYVQQFVAESVPRAVWRRGVMSTRKAAKQRLRRRAAASVPRRRRRGRLPRPADRLAPRRQIGRYALHARPASPE